MDCFLTLAAAAAVAAGVVAAPLRLLLRQRDLL
jgi:hypothetical protein